MDEQQIALVLQMKGGEGVAAVTAELKKEEQALKDLKAAFGRGELTAGEFISQQNGMRQSMAATRDVMDDLRGSGSRGGGGGRGMLGASYAFQDFTSQIQNGFTPALASIQNNIPQILMGLGVGAGFTGVISAGAVALGLMIPLISKAFGAQSKEEIAEFAEKAKEAAAAIKSVHAEFEKLRNKPTTAEEESAASIKAVVESRPNAAIIKKALMGQLTPAEVEAQVQKGMTPEDRAKALTAGQVGIYGAGAEEITARGGIGNLSDETIERLAGGADRTSPLETINQARARARTQLFQERNRLRTLEAKARGELAEQTVVDITKAGPEGDRARRRLDMAKGALPENIQRELDASSPEAIKAFDDEMEKVNEGHERAKQARIARQAAAKKAAQEGGEAASLAAQVAREATKAGAMDEQLGRGPGAAMMRAAERAGGMAAASAKQRQVAAARQAAEAARDLEIANNRANQDAEYWNKVNSGMITAADQISRRSELLRRSTEDAVRRIQEVSRRSEESMIGGGLDN